MIPLDIKKQRVRRFRTREEMAGIAQLAGVDLTVDDIRNIEKWTNQGCMKGIRKLSLYLRMMGYQISARRHLDL